MMTDPSDSVLLALLTTKRVELRSELERLRKARIRAPNLSEFDGERRWRQIPLTLEAIDTLERQLALEVPHA